MASANQAPSVIDYALQCAAAGTSAILAFALGTAPDAAARIGLYADTTGAAEKIAMIVGGQTGPIWTRNGSVVDVVNTGASTATRYVSTIATGTAPLTVASTTVVANLNVSALLGKTWASPDPIGTGTPAAITGTAFTVGTQVSTFATTGTPNVQMVATSAASSTLGQMRFTSSTSNAPSIIQARSKGTTVGDYSAVTTNDALGSNLFQGSDGAGMFNAANILVSVDAAVSTGIVPGRIALRTANTSGSLVTGYTLDSSQNSTFAGVILAPSGSVGAPSHAFSTDATTGLYRVSGSTIAVAGGGVAHAFLSPTQTLFTHNAGVVAGTAPIQSLGTGYVVFFQPDTTVGGFSSCAFGQATGFVAKRASGTSAALTALALDESIRLDGVIGYEGTTPAFTAVRTSHIIAAAEAWASTAQGFYQDWYCTTTGATTATRKMRLHASGSLTIGTITDGMTAGGSLAITQDLAHRGTKVGFYNTAPVVVPTSTTDLRTALINLGLYTTGGASPLNLNGGALTAAAITGTGVASFSGTTEASAVGTANVVNSGGLGVAKRSFLGTIGSTFKGNVDAGVQDATAAVAGQVGEVIASVVSTYTNYTTTATKQQLTSIALTPGDWVIFASITYYGNSATNATDGEFTNYLCDTTASATGAVEGETIAYGDQPVTGTLHRTVTTIYHENISASKTKYLNGQAAFTLGNPQFVCSLKAVRIR